MEKAVDFLKPAVLESTNLRKTKHEVLQTAEASWKTKAILK